MIEQVGYLTPSIFSEEAVVAGFSTRIGGVSQPPFSSLNLGMSTGDDPEHVRQNRERLFSQHGFSLDELVICGQVHGVEVLHATHAGLFPGFDGAVTATPGLVLCLTAADCASVLLADASNKVIGACHAGWRGTVGGIVTHTVHAMTRLGAEAASTKAYVSPCISLQHFEVGPEVALQFAAEHVAPPGSIGNKKDHVDLQGALVAELIQCGIRANHIESEAQCTYANKDRFFSYRAEQGQTGRMMGFISMNAF